MEQEDSISFSSVVAALLLLYRRITSVEIVNFLSKLSCEEIDINEENDDIDNLLICVGAGPRYSYFIKDKLSYDTILYGNVTVYDFLQSQVDKKVLNVIQNDGIYSNLYNNNAPKREISETNTNYNSSPSNCKIQKKSSVFSKVKCLRKQTLLNSFMEWGSVK